MPYPPRFGQYQYSNDTARLANALIGIHERKLARQRQQMIDEENRKLEEARLAALQQQSAQQADLEKIKVAELMQNLAAQQPTPLSAQPSKEAADISQIPQTPEELAAFPMAERQAASVEHVPVPLDKRTHKVTLANGQELNFPLLSREEKMAQRGQELQQALQYSPTAASAAIRAATQGNNPFAQVKPVSGGYLTVGQDGAVQFHRTAQPPAGPTQRFTPKMVLVDGKEVQANYDALTGKYHDPETGAILHNVKAAPTAEMRNKEKGRELVDKSIGAIEPLSEKIITRIGPEQRLDAIKRGAQAVYGTDPTFRTYQDARQALAGNLAVAQQGSRPSDADIKAIWLPLIPDPYSDTAESMKLKWDIIKTMSGAKAPVQIHTKQEYDELPIGAEYIDPNGVRRRKGK